MVTLAATQANTRVRGPGVEPGKGPPMPKSERDFESEERQSFSFREGVKAYLV